MKLGVMGFILQRYLESRGCPSPGSLDALFRAASELGVQSLELGLHHADRKEFVDRVGELKGQYGIGIELGYGPIVREDKAFESATQFVDAFESFVETVCEPLGVTCIGVVAPFHGGRWLRQPSLEEQLERLIDGLSLLAPVAEKFGVYIGIENHADYRGSELVQVIEGVGSRSVGVKFDTGNTYCAIEEPLTTAEAVAKYTVMTHIKDVIVEAEPCNRGLPGGLLALTECPLGQGHVDLPAIVSMLAANSPRGDDLVLTIECQPNHLEASVEWAKQHFAPVLG